ncbi:MAG: hypothetical protein ABSB29_07160 [Nitrososphaerales archaeon]|jgi:hypothetical protein
MCRTGVSDAIATGLLIVGILIGATGYYAVTTYQTTTNLVSVTTLTLNSTVTVYPVPDNVTLAFIASSGIMYNYSIQAGSSSTSGTWHGIHNLTITGLFQGQTILVIAFMIGLGSSCLTGHPFTVSLFVNGQMVAQSHSVCMGNRVIISYTV